MIELNFTLNKNTNNEINKAIEKGLTMAMIFAQGDAKKKAAVDTGELRDNIFYEVEMNEAILYDLKEYAPYVEFGTFKMQAQPFLRPAVFGNIKKLENIIAQGMRSIL